MPEDWESGASFALGSESTASRFKTTYNTEMNQELLGWCLPKEWVKRQMRQEEKWVSPTLKLKQHRKLFAENCK